ncbi:hypothetical protein AND_008896 [Anopheles darlingi]|uniref:Uncharacterized protein n=1 Tax=Anopheles darlingi TaxID=43151 RepID=W5J7Y5_ANODA|nr:hypothetical protein AND_008896 [Anopheles darlingi]
MSYLEVQRKDIAPHTARIAASEYSYCSRKIMLHYQRSMLLRGGFVCVLLVLGAVVSPVAAEKEASEGFFAQLWDSIFGSKSDETSKNGTVSYVPTEKNESNVPEPLNGASVRLNESTSTETITTVLTKDSVEHPKVTLPPDDKIVSTAAGNDKDVSNATIKESNSTTIDPKLTDYTTEKSVTPIVEMDSTKSATQSGSTTTPSAKSGI